LVNLVASAGADEIGQHEFVCQAITSFSLPGTPGSPAAR
jgi:hypothetical protein